MTISCAAILSAVSTAALIGLALCPSSAHAANACPSVDAAWLNRVAAGANVSYGFSVDATIPPAKPNAVATPISSVGVVTLFGTSVQPSNGASLIAGTVSGTEMQNVGGTVTALSFGPDGSTFTIDTHDCTGTMTRTFTNGSVIVWQLVVVDGGDTIRTWILAEPQPFGRECCRSSDSHPRDPRGPGAVKACRGTLHTQWVAHLIHRKIADSSRGSDTASLRAHLAQFVIPPGEATK